MMGAVPASETDATGVFALLGIISDPDKAAKVMSDLATATKNNQEALKALQDAQGAKAAQDADTEAKLKTATEEATAARNAALVEQDKNNALIAKLSTEFAQKRADLEIRSKTLADKETQHAANVATMNNSLAASSANLDQRALALKECQDTVEQLRAKAASDAADAAALKAQYEAKLARLRDMANE